MARTATITTEQILEAARVVFLEQGVNATTVDVAHRAGISSASIFKRYPTKEALFFAAMSQMPERRVWTPELEASIGHGDPRADLLLIAQRIAAYTAEMVPRMMLLRSMGESPELPAPPRVDNDLAAMIAYFGREMGLGRIVAGDPTIPALALLHATAGFALGQARQPATTLVDTTRFLQDFVGLLWRGLEPTEEGE
ncbi:MAG: TetR/AcrR family transcriptional regulator [Pleurocapsa sp. SU_196_0]|nr:TetR/AcrR family transcriptional regulator [Pleurocapsa sp. SU_196_0]